MKWYVVAAGLLAVVLCAMAQGDVRHPVYPISPASGGRVSPQQASAMASGLAPYLQMSEAQLRALVPRQSGVFYCGCPHCSGGTTENNMTWSPDDPDHVRCQYCGHRFPSPDYPLNGEVRVTGPRGDEAIYRYYESPQGRRYYFEARAWYARIHYYDGIALRLAQVYDATRDERYASAAAALIDEYARVVPGYVPKYEHPFEEKRFFGAEVKPPYPVEPYRAARYYWWAYGDIPRQLVLAYDLIHDSDAVTDEMRRRIEDDLIRGSVEWVKLNPDAQDNMGPLLWQSMAEAGRVIGEPDYVHDAAARAMRLLREQFFYDGSWREGTPSYHLQVTSWLKRVMDALRGYTDPPGYVSPRDGVRFENFDPEAVFPGYARARVAVEAMRLPDGRYAPVHDTWPADKGEPLAESRPRLLPALGHAILGGGTGKQQLQAHLEFSGAHGHEHADNLATIIWANGREAFSDLGYTYTKARVWATATASHNTVVIDERNHNLSETDGNLLLWGAGDLRRKESRS